MSYVIMNSEASNTACQPVSADAEIKVPLPLPHPQVGAQGYQRFPLSQPGE